MPKKWTEEELVELHNTYEGRFKKLNPEKLKDDNVVFHPEIFSWRNTLKLDLPLLRSLNEGQIQAIIFRKRKDGKDELIVGSRRYSHLKLLGWSWDEIKKEIHENVSDRKAITMALSENLYRKDMSPMEEARAIGTMLKTKMPVKHIAKLLGMSETWVRNRKALLELPKKIRKVFEEKKIDFGYSIPLLKLKGNEEAQRRLLEKIADRSYSGIKTIEDAEKQVTKALAEVKALEELLAKYGPCPKCGSRKIGEPQWGDKDKLFCKKCEYEWNRVTKDPWEYYELKERAKELGLELELETPQGTKLTPIEVAEIIEERTKGLEPKPDPDLPDKFRCKLPLLTLLKPMIEGDNIQKLVVKEDSIEIQLVEDSGLQFNGLRKDYKAGEKCRIEVSSWSNLKEMVKKVHAYIEAREQAAS